MKNKKTIYQFVLDKSGSMSDCLPGTISGFNEQLKMITDLQAQFPEQVFCLSLTTFNDKIAYPFRDLEVQNIPLLSIENYVPSGMTALLDAIGLSIKRIKEVHGESVDNDEASVVFVILTDGHENSSRFFDYLQIASQIKELESNGKWNFSFVGADIVAMHTSRMLNIQEQNVMSFSKQDMRKNIMDIGNSMGAYARSKEQGNIKQGIFDIFEEKDRRKNKE